MLEEVVRRQRRRKRRRPQQENSNIGSTNASTTIIAARSRKAAAHNNSSFEDDSSLAFLDSNGVALSDRRAIQVNLPRLLEARQSGRIQSNARSKTSWQQQALFQFTKVPGRTKESTTLLRRHGDKPNSHPQRRQWRQFAQRYIPFTQLGTPVVDAVLALERKGSYVLCLGAQRPGSEVPLLLALRFYGVPSPAGIQKQKQVAGRAMGIAPLLQTVPLLYNDVPETESMEETIFNFRRNVSPASTPVSILISHDWNIGMAQFQPSNVWREEGPVGSLVLFSLPRSRLGRKYAKAFVCQNVRIGGSTSFTLRNLLWRVDKVPCLKQAEEFTGRFESILRLPGYLVLNDEEDGFRLTWVLDQWSVHEGDRRGHNGDSVLKTGFIPSSNILSRQDTWEEIYYETSTGRRVPIDPMTTRNANPTCGASVFSESFLHVDALLGEILNRRSKKVSEDHPEFYYNLISVAFGGQVADIVIAFLRGGGKRGALGVFVRVDLFSGTVEELDWVQGKKIGDMASLRAWSNSLALNRRMRHVGAGPFSINSKGHSIDWGRLCQESTYIDYDEADDYDASFWAEYVVNPQNKRPPKTVSFASIYPDTDLVTNNAITSCLPVSSLQCKDSPVQLIYG